MKMPMEFTLKSKASLETDGVAISYEVVSDSVRYSWPHGRAASSHRVPLEGRHRGDLDSALELAIAGMKSGGR
jgi:hypothetical protein